MRRFPAVGVLAILMTLGAALPADAARVARSAETRALYAAAARWSATDSLALDRRGRLVEDTGYGTKQRLTRRGAWITQVGSRRWARVIVRTTRDDRVSTVLRRSRGRWRAVASGGFAGPDGDRRDGAQCRRSRIPRLVAVDLGLGRHGAHDPGRRCQGADARRRRAMTPDELAAAVPVAVSDDWSGIRDDLGDCTAREPVEDSPPRGFASRALPAWTVVDVYCTQGTINGQPQLGLFAAVLHDGRPVERISTSEKYLGRRCWSGRALPIMPLRARLELGVCTPQPYGLLDAAR